jgi:hypothetical protein
MGAVIDHLIYAVADVEEAGGRLAALGLPSYAGGSHPQWGTSNRIVPLGPSYLELLGPTPPPFGPDRFLGWMVRGVPMGPDAVPMSRLRTDGSELRWRLDGLPAASLWELDGLVPVHIEWADGTVLPGQAAEPVGSLEAVELGPAGITAARIRLNAGGEVVLGG